jgi:hypothetical protein
MEYNLALSTNFKAEIVGAEEFNFFIQNVSFPTLSITEVMSNYRNEAGFMPGEVLEYDPLTFSFLVAEDLSNYLFLFNWMKSFQTTERPTELFKDVTIHILNNNKLENVKVRFVNSFPTMLGSLEFESNTVIPTALVSQLTLRYQYFEYEVK